MLPAFSVLANSAQVVSLDYHVINAAMRGQDPNKVYDENGEVVKGTNGDDIILFDGKAPMISKTTARIASSINDISNTFSY
jgi:hypothetical protein